MLDKRCDLLITGTGRLARAVCYSMTAVRDTSAKIIIVGRDAPALDELVAVARGRAVAYDSQFSFSGQHLILDAGGRLEEFLAIAQPRIVLHTASLQSPWEFSRTRTAWSRLVHEAGFGITLPLQAVLVARLATALQKFSPGSLLINACYPDAVNALLARLQLPILCGIGNIEILATVARSNLPANSRSGCKIIGHHFNLAAISRGERTQLPRLYLDNGVPVPAEQLWEMLSPLTVIHGPEMNQLTGATAVKLLLALLSRGVAELHLPGPAGLLGGYPMCLRNGVLSLSLPSGASAVSAEQFNEEAAARDGVVVAKTGEVTLTNLHHATALNSIGKIPVRWRAEELEDIATAFISWRNKLRTS